MAVTSVPTTMAGAINYSVVTDSSADWSSVSNSTYFYDKADKLVHYKDSSGTILEIFTQSGLTYFAEAQNTSSPNATTPVDSLTAVSSATNADFAIIPKGNGAIIADIPDGLVTGGNKRGQYAVDLQMARLTNSAVASGQYSVISGGYYNTASNTQATIGGGYQNTASGDKSTISGGGQSNASGNNSTIGGGSGNSASATNSTIGGGASNTASTYASVVNGGFGNSSSGNYSVVSGGASNTASGVYSSVVGGASNVSSGTNSVVGGASNVSNSHSSVVFGTGCTANSILYRNVYGSNLTAVGDAQTSNFIMRMTTADATLTTFTSDGTTASAVNQINLSNNSGFRFKGTIIAKQTGSTNLSAWDIDGLIVRGANAGATTLLISNVTLVQNTPAFGTPILSANTTHGGLKIQIQGLSATNIMWVANIETTEVIYA